MVVRMLSVDGGFGLLRFDAGRVRGSEGSGTCKAFVSLFGTFLRLIARLLTGTGLERIKAPFCTSRLSGYFYSQRSQIVQEYRNSVLYLLI